MTRNIMPLDKELSAPETILDRSDLSKIYERENLDNKKTILETKNIRFTDNDVRAVRLLDTAVINILLIAPYVISYLSITTIFSLGAVTGIESAFENRIMTILLTIPALLPWLFTVRTIKNYYYNFRINLIGLLSLYLLFILPILSISISLRGHGVNDVIILLSTFVLSQIFLVLMAYILNQKGNLISSRIVPLTMFTAIIIFTAGLVR